VTSETAVVSKPSFPLAGISNVQYVTRPCGPVPPSVGPTATAVRPGTVDVMLTDQWHAEQAWFLADPASASPRWVSSLLRDDWSFVIDVAAVRPFPTSLRAVVFEHLMDAPSMYSPATTHHLWARAVVLATWLTPKRFDALVFRTQNLEPAAVANIVSQHRHFGPRHVLVTLMRARGKMDTDRLCAAYRSRGPEYAALVGVFAALNDMPQFRSWFALQQGRDAGEDLLTTYGRPVEALTLDGVRALAAIVEARAFRTFPEAVEAAALTTLTCARRPRRIRLPKVSPTGV
jgi:hypothetical protein